MKLDIKHFLPMFNIVCSLLDNKVDKNSILETVGISLGYVFAQHYRKGTQEEQDKLQKDFVITFMPLFDRFLNMRYPQAVPLPPIKVNDNSKILQDLFDGKGMIEVHVTNETIWTNAKQIFASFLMASIAKTNGNGMIIEEDGFNMN